MDEVGARFASDVKDYAAAYARGFDHERLAAWAASKGYAADLVEGRLAYWLANNGLPGRKRGCVLFYMHHEALLYRCRADVRFVRQRGLWRVRWVLRSLRRAASLRFA